MARHYRRDESRTATGGGRLACRLQGARRDPERPPAAVSQRRARDRGAARRSRPRDPGGRILEIGTSNGYSTIWLADAAEATGGAVTSVEIDPERTELARANLAEAGVTAELLTQDASDVLRGSPDAAWDLVFLDAERPAYAGYWPELVRVLRPDGGIVAIDNALSHADEVAEVSGLIEAEPSVTSALVPAGAGLLLAVRG